MEITRIVEEKNSLHNMRSALKEKKISRDTKEKWSAKGLQYIKNKAWQSLKQTRWAKA